jgi:hypothetical protein
MSTDYSAACHLLEVHSIELNNIKASVGKAEEILLTVAFTKDDVCALTDIVAKWFKDNSIKISCHPIQCTTVETTSVCDSKTMMFPDVVDSALVAKEVLLDSYIEEDMSLYLRGKFTVVLEIPVPTYICSSTTALEYNCKHVAYFVVREVRTGGFIPRFVRDESYHDWIPNKDHGITDEELDEFMEHY